MFLSQSDRVIPALERARGRWTDPNDVLARKYGSAKAVLLCMDSAVCPIISGAYSGVEVAEGVHRYDPPLCVSARKAYCVMLHS